MDHFESPCSGRIVTFVWSLYALAVVVASQAMAGHGLPVWMTWSVASALGVAVLLWTREI